LKHFELDITLFKISTCQIGVQRETSINYGEAHQLSSVRLVKYDKNVLKVRSIQFIEEVRIERCSNKWMLHHRALQK